MKTQKNKRTALFRWDSVHASIQFERAFSGILSFNKKCDLIVMGSHGTSGIEEMVIGSNTEK
jgi:nucleotide-binding universal stress UspA family protein